MKEEKGREERRGEKMGIFEPYRAIGYITSGVPFSVQRLGTETFLTITVGKAFQIYNVNFFNFLFFVFLLSLMLKIIDFFPFFIWFLLQCSKLNLVLIGEFFFLVKAFSFASIIVCYEILSL